MTDVHELYMKRCLGLAERGRGMVHPNPMVGCVVLNAHGEVVGEGWHEQFGGSHAEVVALDIAEEKAQGGTLYVNLEPCSHTGKTPPCVEKILASGIKQVYCGMTDPNPLVSGSGVRLLKERGIEVYSGVLETECQKLNEAFCHFIQTKQPFVILKQAMTLDGKIAARNGQSQWLTGPEARAWVHGLRAQCDGILTTAETIVQDNSRLTVRLMPLLGKPPVRIILDRTARLDLDRYAIFQAVQEEGPVWLMIGRGNASQFYLNQADEKGVRVFEVHEDGIGLMLSEVLEVLGAQNVTQLLVEGGGHIAGAFVKQLLVQKLWLMYGPQLMLDSQAQPSFNGNVLFRLQDALQLKVCSTFTVGDTWAVEAYP